MATSPGGESGAPRLTEKDGKTMQRLTLGEAAEEIKRLRRLTRQNKIDLQKKEEEKGQLEHTVSELQAEMQSAQRAAEKRIREKEREADDLRKQLDKAAEDMRFLQSVSLPINEARKLTYKALRKGRALECLGELFCRNSVTNRMLREGFTAIVENAFGLGHLAFRAEHGVGPSSRTAVESQLRLLRQEQLLLLAENDRLTSQVGCRKRGGQMHANGEHAKASCTLLQMRSRRRNKSGETDAVFMCVNVHLAFFSQSSAVCCVRQHFSFALVASWRGQRLPFARERAEDFDRPVQSENVRGGLSSSRKKKVIKGSLGF
ncbi:hypothetical protein TGP89_418420 [Toxoplasma gondii p89]|uniref:Uncharacterized protein n=1 Tax=Toxoplasma gondii p89 TaxID=943119 RepID=A0A086L4D7_TOXGO|nr:hypothetical protein TGP89_418420 [Toxoplasma gondii p89]